MRKLFLMLAMLVIAAPAMAAVDIIVTDIGSGQATIGYNANAAVSGFGLKITLSGSAKFVSVTPALKGEGAGYGIFPASFNREINPADPNYNDPDYTPVADAGDAGAAGTGIGESSVIIEMGALYETTGPGLTGTLCTIEGDATATVTVTEDSTRGGIVYETAVGADMTQSGDGTITVGYVYPDCWGYSGTGYMTQCHGDIDNNVTVDIADWPAFRDGFAKNYPDAQYKTNACGDYDRNGSIDIADWPEFRDNFAKTPASDCATGDLNEVYKP